MKIRKGEIFMMNLENSNKCSHIQSGERPVVILQNDKGNKYSDTTIIAPLTSKAKKLRQPTHYLIQKNNENGLSCNSVCLLEQIMTIDVAELIKKIGVLNENDLHNIDDKLKVSLQI